MNDRTLPSSSPRRLKRRAPSPMALEARVMFDGAAVDAAASAAAAAERAAQDAAARESATKVVCKVPETPAPVAPARDVDVRTEPGGPRVLAAGDPAANGGRREVVFVDGAVSDWQTLVAGLGTGLEVVLLDSSRDGLQQIADYLQGRNDIDAIHLVGHGESGKIQLGTASLDSDHLSSYLASLAAIGAGLKADGDLLLYGCDVGQGELGVNFLKQLALHTGADVAASSDATGAAAKGGDWNLETTVGSIETAGLQVDAYAGLLATPVVGNLNDRTITEDAPAVVIDSDITISSGGDYVGGYLRFEVGGAGSGDVLSMISAADVNALGAISFDNGTVYQGTGSGRLAIGVVDPYENGEAGKALKIVFYKGFTNGSFESADITGWTEHLSTYPLDLNGQGINYSFSGGAQTGSGTVHILPGSSLNTTTISVVSGGASSGNYSLQLSSGSDGRVPGGNGDQPDGNNSLHGPYISSDSFTGFAGQQMALDWKAQGGSDAYEVFGYLLAAGSDGQFGTADDVRTQLFAQRGDTQAWTTETFTFAADGLYKFEFLCGSYDKTGGTVLGATLYVDNIRLLTSAPTINDATLTAIARQVTYGLNKDAPPSERTVTVTAQSGDGGQGSASATLSIGPVNDAPVNDTAPAITGTVHPGQTVSLDPGVWHDPDGATNLTYTYQWYLADDASGSNATPIAGATGTSCTLQDGQLGQYLAVKVTVTDDGFGTGGNQSSTVWTAYREVANDAPVAATQGVTVQEDGSQVITLAASDGDGDALSTYSVATLPASGSLYQVNEDGSRGALIQAGDSVSNSGHRVLYVPAADASGSGLGSFTFTATDRFGAISGAAAVTVDVAAVNDAPELSGGSTVNYTENDGNTPVRVAPGLVLGDDVFGGNLGGAVLTINIDNASGGDQLSLHNEGTGPGQVGFAINQGTGAITYGGVTVGILSSTNDGQTLVITFASNVAPVVNPADVTLEAVQAVLRNIEYFNSSNNPSVGARDISFSLNDGGGTANGGAATGSVHYQVNVAATNDAPTNITLGDGSNGNWGSTVVAPGHNLVDGLGGSADFGEVVLSTGDDGYTPIDVSSVFPDGFNFCGTTYSGSDFYVGWNGYITFGEGMSSYTPSGISQSDVPIIAPMFLDFDTRGGASTADWASDGGNSSGTNRIHVDVDPVNQVVTITFDDVGAYNSNTGIANAFQIRLWNKGGGDFDIEFRYENVGWAQHGGSWTSAGWSAGDRATFSEIDGSMTSTMANLAGMSNIDQAGVFLWQVRDGGVRDASVAVTENTPPGTVVTHLSATDPDDTQFTYAIKLPDGSYSDSDGTFQVVRNNSGGWDLVVAPGANIDYETAQSHSITLKVTDSGGNQGADHALSYEKTFTIPVLDVNEPPEVVHPPVQPGNATESVAFNYTLAPDTFRDGDGETLSYSATLADGSPLPGWLSFDPLTLKLSGTPDGGDIGSVSVRVVARDSAGQTASVTLDFQVAGVPPVRPDATPPTTGGGGGDVPPLTDPVPLPPGLPGIPTDPGAPGGTGGGGSGGVSGGGDVTGTPAVGDPGGIPSLVMPPPDAGTRNGSTGNGSAGGATGDRGGADGLTRADGFQVVVRSGGGSEVAALRLGTVIDDQQLPADQSFQVTIPADAFIHTKVDAVIQLSARMADGSALPPWVEFDAGKGIFRGRPPLGFAGDLEIVITARDQNGNIATQRLRVRVGEGVMGKPGLTEQLRAAGSHARAAERQGLLQAARASAGVRRAA